MFSHWSPAQLMHATGYRHNLLANGDGQRISEVIGERKRHVLGANAYGLAHRLFSRLARMRGVDPASPPQFVPLALINDAPQDPARRGRAL